VDWISGGTADEDVGDARIEVTARSVTTDDAAFGIICHYQNSNNYYYAGVSADGYYAIIREENDSSTVLTDATNNQWQSSDLIPLNAASYRVALMCADETLTLYVDDVEIASVFDSSFTDGDVGLFVQTFTETPAEVYFDDFVVLEQR
jgi:hypothetical protein